MNGSLWPTPIKANKTENVQGTYRPSSHKSSFQADRLDENHSHRRFFYSLTSLIQSFPQMCLAANVNSQAKRVSMALAGPQPPQPMKQVIPIKSNATRVKTWARRSQDQGPKPKPRLAPRFNSKASRDNVFGDSFRSAPSGQLVLLPRVSKADLTECLSSSSTDTEPNAEWSSSVEPRSAPGYSTPRPETQSFFLTPPPVAKASQVYMEHEMFLPEAVCLPAF